MCKFLCRERTFQKLSIYTYIYDLDVRGKLGIYFLGRFKFPYVLYTLNHTELDFNFIYSLQHWSQISLNYFIMCSDEEERLSALNLLGDDMQFYEVLPCENLKDTLDARDFKVYWLALGLNPSQN